MKVATQAAATDPQTRRIDMDMITTGRGTAEREFEKKSGGDFKGTIGGEGESDRSE